MTALEIVQTAYPGIPVAILNQFAALLPAEASAINSEFAKTDSVFFPTYNSYVTNIRRPNASFRYMHPSADQRMYLMQAAFTLLNPKNQNDKVTVTLPAAFWASDTIVLRNPPPHNEGGDSATRTANFILTYDRRLFANPSLRLMAKGFTIAPSQGALYINRNYWAITTQPVVLIIDTAPYFGIEAIKVMYENGITIADVNYDDVYTFATYISAYKKFATQIDAEKSLLEQQARNTVNNYKQQLDDQAAREYADLQAKKIQLLIAIDNDAKSAQRDFQNMLLTAQGLKNQIGGNLV